MSTIFDKILDGEIPCHRVYEDEHVLAFLDIGPLSRGHTLVIPKERKARLHELSDGAAAALGRVLPRLCRAVAAATGAAAYNVLQNNGRAAGQVVEHVHFHIIPRFGERGLGIGWNPGELAADEAAELKAKIAAAYRGLSMGETQSLQRRYAPESRCFGCGPANPEGLRIESFPAAGGEVVCDWTPRKCHEAFDDCLNGGIVGAVLDCHGNWTAGWHLMDREGLDRPPLTVTAEYRVKLRRPTPTKGPLRLTARAVSSDGPWVEIEATLVAGGEVTATFRGRFVAVGPDHPAARHGLGTWEG